MTTKNKQEVRATDTSQKKIVLAGGTGFIGQYIQKYYQQLGYQVIIITRRPDPASQEPQISWNDTSGIAFALDNAALVVNLAGKSVNCRYTKHNKQLIFSSRLKTTAKLGEAIARCQHPPALWINSSTATIYRHAEDHQMTEKNGQIGAGFSVEVAKAWEKAFFGFHLPATRQAALRISIVLGQNGGALPAYKRLVRFGLGGVQGSGNQMFSWVHIADVASAIRYIEDQELTGIFNLAAPEAVTNREFMRALRSEVKMPLGIPLALPQSALLLKLGAGIIGTSSELLLKSRWVYPENLLEKGFIFQYPNLKEALHQILSRQ